MTTFPKAAEGVLPNQWIERIITDGHVLAVDPIPKQNIQPASLDLRLGVAAHRLRCSFLPDSRPIEQKLRDFSVGEPIPLTDGAVLEKNVPYLIPLIEELDLPRNLRARTNPKSSTGRVDVFTRVISDRSYRFDDIRAGYRGHLYLEVVPRSFTVMVRTGLALNQIRFLRGNAPVSDAQLRDMHADDPLLYRDDGPLPSRDFAASNGLFLSLDLKRPGTPVGYRAKPHSGLLDLTRVEHHEPSEYWDVVAPEPGGRVVLAPEAFYLLLSDESVRIPPNIAAEMTAYDPTSGELRTHYAGFFDPGFGHDRQRLLRGSRATLEIRAHDVPFAVEHRQRVCKLSFEQMLEEPDTLYGEESRSNYQSQQATLSKHFKFDRPRPAQLELEQSRLR